MKGAQVGMGRWGRGWAICTIAAAALAAGQARSADITLVPPPAGQYMPFPSVDPINYAPEEGAADFSRMPHYRIVGPIEPGDTEKLKAIHVPMDGFEAGLVSFDSPGGNYREALELGDFINEHLLQTAVLSGDRCVSACAFAFMGGWKMVVRNTHFIPARHLHIGGVLGFHAPSLPGSVPAEVAESSGDVLLEQFAAPTRDNIRELQVRADRWQLSPDLVSEILLRTGAEDFVMIDRWRRARDSLITPVAPGGGSVRTLGAVEAEQACDSLVEIFQSQLFRSATVEPGFGAGAAAGESPDAHRFPSVWRLASTSLHEIVTAETSGQAQLFRLTRGTKGTRYLWWFQCDVSRVPGQGWTIRIQDEFDAALANSPARDHMQRAGFHPVTYGIVIGPDLPWNRIAGADLFLHDPERLTEGMAPDVIARADRLDFCNPPAPGFWPVVCRFPTLHRSLRLLAAVVETHKARAPQIGGAYARWQSEVDRLCRPAEVNMQDAVALTMAGYCGLKVALLVRHEVEEALGLRPVRTP